MGAAVTQAVLPASLVAQGHAVLPRTPTAGAWPGTLLYPALLVHRITESFELQGTFEDCLVQPPAMGRDPFH